MNKALRLLLLWMPAILPFFGSQLQADDLAAPVREAQLESAQIVLRTRDVQVIRAAQQIREEWQIREEQLTRGVRVIREGSQTRGVRLIHAGLAVLADQGVDTGKSTQRIDTGFRLCKSPSSNHPPAKPEALNSRAAESGGGDANAAPSS